MNEKIKRIVDALRMCNVPSYLCEGCPVHAPGESCQNDLTAADMLEKLAAENERCHNECKIDCLRDAFDELQAEHDIWKARCEAAENEKGTNRVLALEEVKRERAVWLEKCNLNETTDIRPILILYGVNCDCCRAIYRDMKRKKEIEIDLEYDSYGVDWRCWWHKPTEAERDATTWED